MYSRLSCGKTSRAGTARQCGHVIDAYLHDGDGRVGAAERHLRQVGPAGMTQRRVGFAITSRAPTLDAGLLDERIEGRRRDPSSAGLTPRPTAGAASCGCDRCRRSAASASRPRRSEHDRCLASMASRQRAPQLFKQRFEGLVEVLERRRLRQALAVDEERRRGVDAERLGGARADGRRCSSSSFWSVRHLSKLSCVKPACLAISNSFGVGFALHEGPVVLRVEQRA